VFVQHKPRNSNTQKFAIRYVDNTKVDRRYSKGETNKEFGLKVGLPFSIYTRMACGKTIDIVGNSLVVKRKNGAKTQNWIFNDDKRTIQSLEFPEQSFGIHADGKNRSVELYKTTSAWFQTFKYINENIVNQRGLVLEVSANKCQEGQPVIAWKKHNGKNQRWIVRYGENNGSDQQRKGKDSYFGLIINEPFYAWSKSGTKQTIEVIGGRNLGLRKFERNKKTQQFYLDSATKTIKSVAYKDKSWDIQDSGQSTNMQIWKTNNRWFQMFKYVGDRFQNERGQFVSVQNKDNIGVQKSANGWLSRWNVRYVKDEQNYIDGEFHPRYGFYCNRPFFIVSKKDSRYLESISAKVVTKTRNGHTYQNWRFNCKTETMMLHTTNQSFMLDQGGRRNLVRTSGINKNTRYTQWYGQFQYKDEMIVNTKNGQVVDNTQSKEGVQMTLTTKNGSIGQKWTIMYQD
jgi:hypothetical protein